jgi:hypothetical protein
MTVVKYCTPTPDVHILSSKKTGLSVFTEQFHGMSKTEIDGMMQSFAFKLYIQRPWSP